MQHINLAIKDLSLVRVGAPLVGAVRPNGQAQDLPLQIYLIVSKLGTNNYYRVNNLAVVQELEDKTHLYKDGESTEEL